MYLAVLNIATGVQDGGVVDDLNVARLENLADVEGWVLSQACKGPAHAHELLT